MPLYLVETTIRAVIDATTPEQASQRLTRKVEHGVEILPAKVGKIVADGDVPGSWADAVPLDGDASKNGKKTVRQHLNPMLPVEVPRFGKTAYQGEDDCG